MIKSKILYIIPIVAILLSLFLFVPISISADACHAEEYIDDNFEFSYDITFDVTGTLSSYLDSLGIEDIPVDTDGMPSSMITDLTRYETGYGIFLMSVYGLFQENYETGSIIYGVVNGEMHMIYCSVSGNMLIGYDEITGDPIYAPQISGWSSEVDSDGKLLFNPLIIFDPSSLHYDGLFDDLYPTQINVVYNDVSGNVDLQQFHFFSDSSLQTYVDNAVEEVLTAERATSYDSGYYNGYAAGMSDSATFKSQNTLYSVIREYIVGAFYPIDLIDGKAAKIYDYAFVSVATFLCLCLFIVLPSICIYRVAKGGKRRSRFL